MDKTPSDFCSVYDDGTIVSLRNFLFSRNMEEEFCALRSVEFGNNCYNLYYEFVCLDGLRSGGHLGVTLDEHGNIREANPSRDKVPIAIVHFDKPGFLHYKKTKKHEHKV